MEKEKLFAQIKGGLIVSCQALEHEPLYTKEGGVMPLMAKAAAMSGAVGIRANTVRDITQIKQVVDLPIIGIIKKDYPGTPMYITVTMKEVDELVECGVDILAVQGTGALRPDGSTSAQFIRAIKAKYPDQLVMADCDNLKIVNDTMGHAAGDDFIRSAAVALRSAMPRLPSPAPANAASSGRQRSSKAASSIPMANRLASAAPAPSGEKAFR